MKKELETLDRATLMHQIKRMANKYLYTEKEWQEAKFVFCSWLNIIKKPYRGNIVLHFSASVLEQHDLIVSLFATAQHYSTNKMQMLTSDHVMVRRPRWNKDTFWRHNTGWNRRVEYIAPFVEHSHSFSTWTKHRENKINKATSEMCIKKTLQKQAVYSTMIESNALQVLHFLYSFSSQKYFAENLFR